MYLDIAQRISEESHAIRLKVGAVFVSEDGVMSTGINGLPPDGSNECEHKIYDKFAKSTLDHYDFIRLLPYEDEHGRYRLVTKDETSHAEENLFSKLMRQGVSTYGGSIFLTHSPCINCAKIIIGAGIKSVYFSNNYGTQAGPAWLSANGVFVRHFNMEVNSADL